MTYELYLITNKVNGKRYVGQTQSNIGYLSRWREHINEAMYTKGHRGLLHNAIFKYGPESFDVKLLIHDVEEKDIDRLEVLWIKKFKTFYLADGSWGYNMTQGGQGIHGYIHTAATTAKMSIASTKYWERLRNNPELLKARNKKVSEGLKGIKRTSATRKKLSQIAKARFSTEPGTFTGKHHTEAAKRKVSIANTGRVRTDAVKRQMVIDRGRPVAMCDLITGVVIKEFQALSIARDYLIENGYTNSKYATDSIRVACNVPGKVMYGFQWKFISSVTTNPDECKDVGQR